MKINTLTLTLILFFLSSINVSSKEKTFSPNLDGKSITDIQLTPPTISPVLNIPNPSIFDIPTPPPPPSISWPKPEIPISENIIIKPIKTPGTIIPGIAVELTLE